VSLWQYLDGLSDDGGRRIMRVMALSRSKGER
jgi:hypothetical protein